ncbi:MAG: hypothetical protein LBD92_07000 [Oscillospiraceae bacterium]|nr:hypothetical protein [Oscillospiraceae bacterium]
MYDYDERFDLNGDGKLDFDEAVAMLDELEREEADIASFGERVSRAFAFDDDDDSEDDEFDDSDDDDDF